MRSRGFKQAFLILQSTYDFKFSLTQGNLNDITYLYNLQHRYYDFQEY
jgi:hypothetical protein